jgi:thioredoxin 1
LKKARCETASGYGVLKKFSSFTSYLKPHSSGLTIVHFQTVGRKFAASFKLLILKSSIMAKEFTDKNFQSDVLASDKLSVIDFWAEWCGPCRAIGPVIEELSKEYDGKVNIGKVNVDDNPQISMNYGITSIPAILFIRGGQVVDKLVGAQPKGNFVKKIEQHLNPSVAAR